MGVVVWPPVCPLLQHASSLSVSVLVAECVAAVPRSPP